MAKITSINISPKKGTFKQPVERAELRVDYGIVGDAHAGNWHRQISLLAQESIDKMIALGLPDLTPGKFAENITTEGISLYTLPVGTILRLGACRVEVTQIGKECHQHCEIYKGRAMHHAARGHLCARAHTGRNFGWRRNRGRTIVSVSSLRAEARFFHRTSQKIQKIGGCTVPF